ncbi:Translocase of inner mitochondrial membrane 44 homolog (Yeast) [Seminavis robusta]|uniref:Translocase of inner mitochondrial membrane 44 homolog (Yeast) n=1 Tax=Seminavis robusta TaxID=568900 RepID=A0A9N8DL96_9STRA|nr:Translocase of inner mitochondrial membrane 44 homolog (Yeast) [Seminavis robusta]|eukprot:Sro220_g090670.1 Translocase of inner mitochondrial membrane 44 homolog (Yeast) (333) ;mRNA; f:17610-18608
MFAASLRVASRRLAVRRTTSVRALGAVNWPRRPYASSSEDKKLGFLQRFRLGLVETWQELLGVHDIRVSSSKGSMDETSSPMYPMQEQQQEQPGVEPFDLTGIPTMDIDASVASPWERLQRRLAAARIIDKAVWNPNTRGERQTGSAILKIQRLDPKLITSLDQFRSDMTEKTIPLLLKWVLEGDVDNLQRWLGPQVLHKVASEIKARHQEGVVLNPSIIEVCPTHHAKDVWAITTDDEDITPPCIVLHFICQQVHCAIDKEQGTILEGSKDEIVYKSYVAAFQPMQRDSPQQYFWGIADFRYNGPIARYQMTRHTIEDEPDYLVRLLDQQK